MSARERLRDDTLELLVAWQQSLPPVAAQSPEDVEIVLNYERIYERWRRKVTTEARREARREALAAGKAEGLAAGKAEGLAAGKAEAVLAVLEGRGLPVSAAQRKRVLGCADHAQLDAWLRAAGVTPSAKDLLGPVRPARRAGLGARRSR
jgi:flagellar biosynthesis/type III secretory pathway protein FliH